MADQVSAAEKVKTVIEEIIANNRTKLALVRGNFLLHIPNVAAWTVVTSGARIGVHEGGTDDEIAFALSCDAELLDQLLAGVDIDIEPHLASGKIKMDGDVEVFSRFLTLDKKQNVHSIRAK